MSGNTNHRDLVLNSGSNDNYVYGVDDNRCNWVPSSVMNADQASVMTVGDPSDQTFFPDSDCPPATFTVTNGQVYDPRDTVTAPRPSELQNMKEQQQKSTTMRQPDVQAGQGFLAAGTPPADGSSDALGISSDATRAPAAPSRRQNPLPPPRTYKDKRGAPTLKEAFPFLDRCPNLGDFGDAYNPELNKSWRELTGADKNLHQPADPSQPRKFQGFLRSEAQFHVIEEQYRAVRTQGADPGAGDAARCFPEGDDAAQCALVERLFDALADESEREDKENYQVHWVRQNSDMELELMAWKLLLEVREMQNGWVDVPVNGTHFEWESMPSFADRFEAVLRAVRANKSIVYNLASTDMYRRVAACPAKEYIAKQQNRALNDQRADHHKQIKEEVQRRGKAKGGRAKGSKAARGGRAADVDAHTAVVKQELPIAPAQQQPSTMQSQETTWPAQGAGFPPPETSARAQLVATAHHQSHLPRARPPPRLTSTASITFTPISPRPVVNQPSIAPEERPTTAFARASVSGSSMADALRDDDSLFGGGSGGRPNAVRRPKQAIANYGAHQKIMNLNPQSQATPATLALPTTPTPSASRRSRQQMPNPMPRTQPAHARLMTSTAPTQTQPPRNQTREPLRNIHPNIGRTIPPRMHPRKRSAGDLYEDDDFQQKRQRSTPAPPAPATIPSFPAAPLSLPGSNLVEGSPDWMAEMQHMMEQSEKTYRDSMHQGQSQQPPRPSMW